MFLKHRPPTTVRSPVLSGKNYELIPSSLTASKAAVKHMAASLAVEWAKDGIRVNTISPGYMLTPLTQTLLDENAELREKWVDSTPMGRMGNPDDLKVRIRALFSVAELN